MSRLEELIQRLCPDGVEYKKIGEITNIVRGKRLTKSRLLENGLYPVYHGSLSPLGYYHEANRDGDTVIIVNTGGIGGVGYSAMPFWCSDGCFCIEHCNFLLNKFVYYYLIGFQDYFISRIRTGGVPTIDRDTVAKIQIPVPPIEVQHEIVRILDSFTGLIAELTAELTARKKQYEYYRDKLLAEQSENTKYVKLGDIATITRGGNFQKKDFCADGVPCIHYGQIYTRFGLYTNEPITYISEAIAQKSKKAAKNDIVMAVTSENIEDVCKCVAWLGDSDIAVSGHTAIIHHNQNAKYLSYYFHTQMFFEQKKKYAHGTKVIEVTPSKLADIIIPLPPLDEQQRTADILDKFHSLVTDISQGIPAEIEARKKQYEYYRDKLLTFKPITLDLQ